MTFICRNCNKILNDKWPCCSQPNYVQVDDSLCDAVVKFWKLGVQTLYCCEGHLYEQEFYPYMVFGFKTRYRSNKFSEQFVAPSIRQFPDFKIVDTHQCSAVLYENDPQLKFKLTIGLSHPHLHTKNIYWRIGFRNSFVCLLYSIIDDLLLYNNEQCGIDTVDFMVPEHTFSGGTKQLQHLQSYSVSYVVATKNI